MTSITQVQGGLLIALAQTLKRFGKGLDLKGNAFDLAFSSSGIGRMRTATLPGAESGMRSHHCEVYQAVLVRNRPHNIPLNGGLSGRGSLQFGGGSDRARKGAVRSRSRPNSADVIRQGGNLRRGQADHRGSDVVLQM